MKLFKHLTITIIVTFLGILIFSLKIRYSGMINSSQESKKCSTVLPGNTEGKNIGPGRRPSQPDKKFYFNSESLVQPPLCIYSHYLGDNNGHPLFILGDTAWLLCKLDRKEVVEYIENRHTLGFNTIMFTSEFAKNFQGDEPFIRDNDGQYDVDQPLVTPGNNPDHQVEYDYWDHLEYIMEQSVQRGFYVILSLGVSPGITGNYRGRGPAFITTTDKAYAVGHFEGSYFRRFRQYVMFMALDDRAPVYGDNNRLPLYRAVYEGVADGINNVYKPDGMADYSTSIFLAMPRKKDPSSSEWFHDDPAIDINTIQALPADAIARVSEDFYKKTSYGAFKPVFVAENRYEGYQNNTWKDWTQRYQTYTSVFAGAFGAIYGHHDYLMNANWRNHLSAPGASQMQYLSKLMNLFNAEDSIDRIPDQSLIANGQGMVRNQSIGGDRIQATRNKAGTIAMFYTMSGREISVHMDKLVGPRMMAWWYSPRNGKFYAGGKGFERKMDSAAFDSAVPSGNGAKSRMFHPPGGFQEANDWVLLLERDPR